jgi:hypothetical protein
MEGFNGTNKRTIGVTAVHARFRNDVGHFSFCLLGQVRFGSDSRRSNDGVNILNKNYELLKDQV